MFKSQKIIIFCCVTLAGAFVGQQSQAYTAYDDDLFGRVKGNILLTVESKGEAYYVNPTTKEVTYLGRPQQAFEIMREQGIGITNANLERIPKPEDDISTFDTSFANQHKGKIFLQVERLGEAWYINPADGLRYYLGKPEDAFEVMRTLGVGISDDNFEKLTNIFLITHHDRDLISAALSILDQDKMKDFVITQFSDYLLDKRMDKTGPYKAQNRNFIAIVEILRELNLAKVTPEELFDLLKKDFFFTYQLVDNIEQAQDIYEDIVQEIEIISVLFNFKYGTDNLPTKYTFLKKHRGYVYLLDSTYYTSEYYIISEVDDETAGLIQISQFKTNSVFFKDKNYVFVKKGNGIYLVAGADGSTFHYVPNRSQSTYSYSWDIDNYKLYYFKDKNNIYLPIDDEMVVVSSDSQNFEPVETLNGSVPCLYKDSKRVYMLHHVCDNSSIASYSVIENASPSSFQYTHFNPYYEFVSFYFYDENFAYYLEFDENVQNVENIKPIKGLGLNNIDLFWGTIFMRDGGVYYFSLTDPSPVFVEGADLDSFTTVEGSLNTFFKDNFSVYYYHPLYLTLTKVQGAGPESFEVLAVYYGATSYLIARDKNHVYYNNEMLNLETLTGSDTETFEVDRKSVCDFYCVSAMDKNNIYLFDNGQVVEE